MRKERVSEVHGQMGHNLAKINSLAAFWAYADIEFSGRQIFTRQCSMQSAADLKNDDLLNGYGAFYRFFLRRYPLYSGIARLCHHRFFKKMVPAQKKFAVTPVVGGKILAPFNDYIGRCIYFFEEYDRKISWIIDKIVENGDLCLDIGANYGIFSLRMAHNVGCQGRVYAFEPNPTVAECLAISCQISGLQHVRIQPMALGQAAGRLPLFIPRGNAGAATLRADLAQNTNCTEEVLIQTLDQWTAEKTITRCDLIKIDAEGFEYHILSGGRDFLKKHPPKALIFENITLTQTQEAGDFTDLMRSLGFDIFGIPTSLGPPRLRPVSSQTRTVYHDCVALRRADNMSVFQRLNLLR